jgi:hypothetical protein
MFLHTDPNYRRDYLTPIQKSGEGAQTFHFDWPLVPEPAFRFENLVAPHLLKWVHFREDTEGHRTELRYFRDIEGREVDFVVSAKATKRRCGSR